MAAGFGDTMLWEYSRLWNLSWPLQATNIEEPVFLETSVVFHKLTAGINVALFSYKFESCADISYDQNWSTMTHLGFVSWLVIIARCQSVGSCAHL